jgi:hypothetical protein
MSNITIMEQIDPSGNVTEVVNIENEDGSITSMLKSTYDELKANETAKTI